MHEQFSLGRRKILQGMAFGAAAFTTSGLFAEQLDITPRQTEGPFYPDRLPLDTDNDLLVINDKIKPAIGEVTHLTGKILSASGEPIRNAVVEIWQADQNGVYIHSRGGDKKKQDANFQGFGRFTTGSKGEYYFRTIKPTPYVGRTPHIHYAVYQNGKRVLTTQCYIRGNELNKRDGIFQSLRDEKKKELLLVDFNKMEGSKIGELTANFDLVVGQTPNERERPRRR